MRTCYAKLVGGVLGSLGIVAVAIAAEPLPTMKQTTTTTTTTPTVPAPTVTTTPGTPVPGTPTVTDSNAPRKVYDQESLKKLSETICAEGFKAYVGDEGKNVCKNWAKAPDIAYSCVWDKKGPPAFSSTAAGPCNLDYTEYRGNLIITKQQFKSNPPLDYGMQVQCCYRSGSGQ